jgi:hypothetical protein
MPVHLALTNFITSTLQHFNTNRKAATGLLYGNTSTHRKAYLWSLYGQHAAGRHIHTPELYSINIDLLSRGSDCY